MPAPAGALLEQLTRDAAATAAARVTDARAECTRLREDASRAHAAQLAEAIAAREAEAAGALDRARSDTAQRVRLDTLLARDAALDRIFAAAATQLRALDDHPALGDVVGRAIVEALGCVPEDGAIVRCAPRVAEAVRPVLAALGVTVAVTDDAAVPLGAYISSADGTIVVDATFARRLDRDRRALAIVVAHRLEAPST